MRTPSTILQRHYEYADVVRSVPDFVVTTKAYAELSDLSKKRIVELERIVRLLANAKCDVERANIAVMARHALEK